jgi:hypothetical protein
MKKLKITKLTIGELATIWGGGAMPGMSRATCGACKIRKPSDYCTSEPTKKCKLGDYCKTK